MMSRRCEITEDAEIVFIQKENFEFWVHKNRYGTVNHPADIELVRDVFESKVRVKIVDLRMRLISDNQNDRNKCECENQVFNLVSDLEKLYEENCTCRKHIAAKIKPALEGYYRRNRQYLT